ncbi:MAG: response regulator [Methanoregulaceae archaeon]|nr:response regulator [Methanoregulaceae archaeon]
MTYAKILVVEDDPIIASLIANRLSKLGYTLCGAVSSAHDAMAAISTLPPDLILMDISLGDEIDGVQLAEMIRKDSDVPIVFLSSSTDDTTVERVKATRPDGYIVKPFDDRTLRIGIEIALGRTR